MESLTCGQARLWGVRCLIQGQCCGDARVGGFAAARPAGSPPCGCARRSSRPPCDLRKLSIVFLRNYLKFIAPRLYILAPHGAPHAPRITTSTAGPNSRPGATTTRHDPTGRCQPQRRTGRSVERGGAWRGTRAHTSRRHAPPAASDNRHDDSTQSSQRSNGVSGEATSNEAYRISAARCALAARSCAAYGRRQKALCIVPYRAHTEPHTQSRKKPCLPLMYSPSHPSS
jgi:hypothetical protein